MQNNFSLSFTPIKPVVSKSGCDFDVLVKLSPPEKTTKKDNAPLNTCFVLDVSGSMNEPSGSHCEVTVPGYWQLSKYVKPWDNYPYYPNTPHWRYSNPGELVCHSNPPAFQIHSPFECCPGKDYHWVEGKTFNKSVTRLEKVVSATKEAISQLNELDRFSIVTFSNHTNVICDSLLATKANKAKAESLLNNLHANGGTDLHSGWKHGAELVCKHLSPSSVNRVLLLTDGEANIGIKDTDTLSSHTNGLVGYNVSTSTFGVGDSYNEDLLQAMADAGDGQYYYLDNADNISASFNEEFSGLSQLFAKNVQLQITANIGTVSLLNDLNFKNHKWMLPNGIKGHDQYMIVRIKVPVVKSKKMPSLVLNTKVFFNNLDTVPVEVSSEFSVPFALKSVYDNSVEHPDVAQKTLILLAATAKREAMAALDSGDFEKSKSVLRGASQMISACAYGSSLQNETLSLNNLVNMADSGDVKSLRKSALYESYTTTRSKS